MDTAVLDRPKAIRVPCDQCGGTGKRPTEWDIRSGAIVAFGPCTSCLAQCYVLVNAAA